MVVDGAHLLEEYCCTWFLLLLLNYSHGAISPVV